MPQATPQARHRAPNRALTPLDDVVRSTSDGVTRVGRTVLVATTGLALAGAIPASAAPADHPSGASREGASAGVDVTALTSAARAALATSPVVEVPTQAAWAFEAPAITVTANPKPEPVVERVATTSRSAERSSTQAASSAAVPATVAGNAVLEVAARYVGVPYVYGGTTPDGFDCSGFTSYVYAQLGITLPRTSSDQHYAGVVVSRDQAQPGDLIWSPGHIAIYAGGNMMIDSPRPGKTVQFREMWQSNPVFIHVTG